MLGLLAHVLALDHHMQAKALRARAMCILRRVAAVRAMDTPEGIFKKGQLMYAVGKYSRACEFLSHFKKL